MQKQITLQAVDYAQALAKLVATLPVERAAQVYDFARFLQAQPGYPSPVEQTEDDWLNDSEEQLAAEDAGWEALYTQQHDKFAKLTEAARAEIVAGVTEPMFDEHGEWVADELTHNA